jgi:hypothetical protein
MLEAVEGELGLLEVLELMRCVLLCILRAAEGGFCLLQVPEALLCAAALCAALYAGGGGGWVGRM